jgi:hypothetical protein
MTKNSTVSSLQPPTVAQYAHQKSIWLEMPAPKLASLMVTNPHPSHSLSLSLLLLLVFAQNLPGLGTNGSLRAHAAADVCCWRLGVAA